jgi:YD repeat-containing protein
VSGDTNYYISATSVDPNNHVSVSYLDALGRTVYTQQDSNLYGGVPAPTPNEQTTIVYNALDKPTSVKVTDLITQSGQTITTATTTMQYDDLGRLTQLADPDRGTHNYTYDYNGNVIQDVSGTRTIGYAYDLLNRLGCLQDEPSQFSTTGACGTSANGGNYNAYIQNTYDTNKLTLTGTTDYPIGQLTQSVSTTYFSSSAASVTESYEHDARGRSIGEQLQFSLPSAWNVTTALPAYQMQTSYNDADQLTTTVTSTVPSGQGFTTTQVYDATTGVKTGLSNNGTATANLATLSYNSQAQLSSLNFLTSNGGALAIDSLGYDGNLRLQSIAASWQGGSGKSGTIFSQNLTYDAASNLISLTSTQDAVGSNAGGTETSNFCYDEQNRLVWAGNSGTQPAAGKGTCGSGTLANTISGANYNNSYVYTHLGQLWQGPLNGGSTPYQYLYCNSQPHELTGLYSTSSTCSSKSGQGYASSYDAFGNVTSRTFSGTTGTLTYDLLDHLTQWYASSTNQEQYLYDSSGQRMLRRFTNGSGTTILTYPFGIEEHQYSGSGSNQWNIYYYFLASRLLGSLDGNGTQFYLSDAQGSLVSSFTNAPGGASMKSNQLFGPYGNARYAACCLNTAKGFLGQYNDGTGLDYFNARYYDPKAAVFLSADTS